MTEDSLSALPHVFLLKGSEQLVDHENRNT